MFASRSTGSEMAAGWIETKDGFGSAFEAVQEEGDWLLVSGQLVVGRVLRDRSESQARRYSWSLTGVHGAPIQNHGMVDTIEQAQGELMAAWRSWQQWAGMRDIDSSQSGGDAAEGEP
jgi:hypothetical protein